MREPIAKARPREATEPVSNPGKGCATFQRFTGDPLYPGKRWSEEGPLEFPPAPRECVPGYLPSTVAYCRWFWEKLEPEPGRIDFGMIEGALAKARAQGQTLEVRLMPFGSWDQPPLPGWYRDRYATKPYLPDWPGAKTWIEPDYDGNEYFETWGRVIAEFGRRFDGHPDLESVDAAFIGPWGEGAGNPREKSVDRFFDLYAESHPKTPVLANIDGYQLESGIRRGCGWRCDCFGDLRGSKHATGKPYLDWNHTYEAYPQAIGRAGAGEAWKRRPVVLETCATPRGWRHDWYAGPEDLDLVLKQGLKFHASVFMPKSCPIPPEYMDPLAKFCDAIGYRFVMRQGRWEAEADRGGTIALELWIENTGCAPAYRPWKLAARIGDTVIPLDADPREWLPGDAIIDRTIKVPKEMAAGETRLSVGLIGEAGPEVRFANEHADPAGWLPLGSIRIS